MALATTDDPCVRESYFWSESPTGAWHGCSDGNELFFLSTSREGWRVVNTGEPITFEGGPIIAHWTGDNRFVYFSYWLSVDGGDYIHFGRWDGLFRLDLDSGEVVDVLPASRPEEFHTMNFSFSPTSRRLVYVLNWEEPLVIRIQDLNSGEIALIPLEDQFDAAGDFTWSPNGLTLVYAMIDYPSESTGETNQIISVMLVNMNDQSYDIIVGHTTAWIQLNDITDEGLLTYASLQESMVYRMDTVSRQVYTIGTATPYP